MVIWLWAESFDKTGELQKEEIFDCLESKSLNFIEFLFKLIVV